MVRLASYLLLVVFSALAAFQISLALGLPLGEAAWGGQYRVLPTSLRWGSLAATLILGLALLVVLEKLRWVSLLKRPRVINGILLGLGALFGLSALANLASSSPWETYVGFPVATIICGACLFLGTRRVS